MRICNGHLTCDDVYSISFVNGHTCDRVVFSFILSYFDM
jgi:hypothetical protein